jgi:hypothetical protein
MQERRKAWGRVRRTGSQYCRGAWRLEENMTGHEGKAVGENEGETRISQQIVWMHWTPVSPLNLFPEFYQFHRQLAHKGECEQEHHYHEHEHDHDQHNIVRMEVDYVNIMNMNIEKDMDYVYGNGNKHRQEHGKSHTQHRHEHWKKVKV